jgi:oxygen-dependent protoporphyrinogen oxidase
VARLAGELGLAGCIVLPRPGGAWVQLPDGPRELPKTGVLGIPANPWDPEVRRTLGLVGSLRAAADRWLPADFGASAELTSVAELVRARMGKRVLERLVAPVVGGVHSADPALLDIDMVAPGLRAAQRKLGSLSAAVAAQRSARGPGHQAKGQDAAGEEPAGPSTRPGSAVAGLKGGMHTLIAALVADLRSRGVELIPGTRVRSFARVNGRWHAVAGADVAGAGSATAGLTGEREFQADHLVVALDGPTAIGLLSDVLPRLSDLKPAPGPEVRLVTLVVDVPELDHRPRGTGILVAPQTPGIRAKALTHATGKWDWLAAEAGPGTHVLRLSYGRHTANNHAAAPNAAVRDTAVQGGEDTAGSPTDTAFRDIALEDASALLGVAVSKDDVLDWDVVRWEGALPFAAVGHKKRVAEVRGICRQSKGLAVVGGWLAGNGLAAVVADTRGELKRLLSPSGYQVRG